MYRFSIIYSKNIERNIFPFIYPFDFIALRNIVDIEEQLDMT